MTSTLARHIKENNTHPYKNNKTIIKQTNQYLNSTNNLASAYPDDF